MLRLAEILLFLTPFALFILWRALAPFGGLSVRFVAVAAGAITVLFLMLLWYRGVGSMSPHASYIPPTYKNGRIIPGHAAPP
jgi:hypothetical protein